MRGVSPTKKAFADALKELLKTQSFEKVTVSSICRQANMKRTSFYYHFLDKYDLVNWIFDSEFTAFLSEELGIDAFRPDVQSVLPNSTGTYPHPSGQGVDWDLVRATAKYFNEHISFYQKVISFVGQNSFLDHFRELLAPLLNSTLLGLFQDRDDLMFHINFYSDAILAALIRWVNNPKRVSPEELIRLLQSCLYVPSEYFVAETEEAKAVKEPNVANDVNEVNSAETDA